MKKAYEMLIDAYATLVMGKRRTLEEVPETVVVLVEATDTEEAVTSTIRKEVELEIAERIVEILS